MTVRLFPTTSSVTSYSPYASNFGAVSFETQTIRGLWQHEGQVYRDDLVRLFADVSDTPSNRTWFLEFKERLKREFQQLDIWIITHPIELI